MVHGLGFQVSGFSSGVWDLEPRALGPGLVLLGPGLRVRGLSPGRMVHGSGFSIQDVWCTVAGASRSESNVT